MQHFDVHESHLKLCHLTLCHSVQILRQKMRTRRTCHSVVRCHLFGQIEMMTICSSLAPTISHNADAAEVCCALITGHALDATTVFVINANEAWLRGSVGGYAIEAEFPLFTGEELLAIVRDETPLRSNVAAGTLHGPAANAQRQKEARFCETVKVETSVSERIVVCASSALTCIF